MRNIILAVLVLISCAEASEVAEPVEEKEEVKKEPEKHPALPPEALPYYKSVLAYRTAKDSVNVISLFNKSAEAYVANYTANGLEKGKSLALAVHSQVHREVTSEDLDFSDRVLGERIFDRSGVITPDISTLSSETRRCPVVIVVQGILTSTDVAVIGRHDVALAVSRLQGLPCTPQIWGYSNPTAKNSKINPNCFIRALQIGTAVEISKCGSLGDIVEASRQIANLLNFWPGMEQSSTTLAMRISEQRGRGRPVILVGHSQGALLIAEALRAVLDPKQCMYVVTMGSPLGEKSFNLPSSQVQGYVLAGYRTKDPVVYLGQNDFPQFTSELTYTFDTMWDRSSIAERLLMNVKVHSMSGSYMAEYWNTVTLNIFLRIGIESLYKKDCSM